MKIDFSTWILARPSFQISYLEQEETHSTTVIKTDTDECQFTDHVYDDGDDGPEKYFLISKAKKLNSWEPDRQNVWIKVANRKYKIIGTHDISLDPYIEMIKTYLKDVGEID